MQKQTKKSSPKGKQAANKQKQSGKLLVIGCDAFDIKKFSVEEIQMDSDYNKKSNQYITFPRYKYNDKDAQAQFTFKTKQIKITQHGIKKIDNKYVKSDKDRDYFKIPYDESQPECVELFKMFEEIDKYMEKNKDALLGSNLKKYSKFFTYQKIVREPLENLDELVDGEEEEDKKDKKDTKDSKDSKPRMKYAKIKFNTEFPSGELKTFVFVREDGTPRLHDEIKSVTDLTEYFKWNSKCQFVISASKVWFSKSADQKTKTRSYGISFKCQQLEVVERPTSNGAKMEFNVHLFDDDNNDETKEAQDKKDDDDEAEENVKEDDGEDGEDDDDGDEDDDEDDDDKDEEDKEEDDDDDEDEEEEKETKKSTKKEDPPKKQDKQDKQVSKKK